MKSLKVLQAKWQSAIRSQLPAARGNAAKATSLAARKFPKLRAELLAAANPGKKLRAVDEDELPEDEELEDDTELEDVEDEDEEVAPATKRKVNPTSKKAAKSAWDIEADRIAARQGFR